jgi:hypothetical protein
MKIRELFEDADDNSELSTELAGALSQIKSEVIQTGLDSPMSLVSVIEKLEELGLYVTDEVLRQMYPNPPLNNIIASIEGDDVIFKGQRKDTSQGVKPDQSTKTLEKMAKKAVSKRT